MEVQAMQKEKKIAIWLDHTKARLVSYPVTKIGQVISKQQIDQDNICRAEKRLNHKLQELQRSFYKKIENAIKDFSEVLLCGPTDAKIEFYHLLLNQSSHRFRRYRIINAGKMTNSQLIAFVKRSFEN
jgi:stalled ribosome rescue protein Dom34